MSPLAQDIAEMMAAWDRICAFVAEQCPRASAERKFEIASAIMVKALAQTGGGV